MARLALQVDIRAPLEDVFAFVADYRNALQYMEHFQVFQPLTPHTFGMGARVLAKGRLHGIPVATELEIVTFDQDRRLVSMSRSGIRSVSEWSFEAIEGGTRVTFFADYTLTGIPVAGRLVGKLLEDDIKAGTVRTLENLKRVLERRRNGSVHHGER